VSTFDSGEDAGAVRVGVLSTGTRILTEAVPGVRSVSIGFWVPVGSRDEVSGHYGSTHFLEHLLFKGTPTRSAMDIATTFDAVGGEANAATAKESTCYYARVLDTDLPMAVSVLADMVTSAVLDPLEFETERGVILEELAMNQDDPHDVAHEAFATEVYGDHPLARPIGGTPETIKAVPRDAVWAHYRQHYRPDNLIVTASGSLTHEGVTELVERALDQGGWSVADRGEAPASGRRSTVPEVALPTSGTVKALARPTEQAQIIVGCEGLIATDDRRHALSVLGAVLGGGMSSRLFQEIREKRGLAYSTYCFASGHADAGSFGLYAGCAPAVAEQVTELMEAEWAKLARHGITDEELTRAKGQLSGGTVLGLEDPFSRMNRLGRAEIMMGELPTLDTMLARIDAVTAGDVQSLAEDLLSRPRSRVVVANPS
jgi:predicted Zn-dependent peptidase